MHRSGDGGATVQQSWASTRGRMQEWGVFPRKTGHGSFFAPQGGQLSAPSERAMNKLVVGLLGATALATTLILVRQQREPVELKGPRVVSGEGENPMQLSLEKLRAVGF